MLQFKAPRVTWENEALTGLLALILHQHCGITPTIAANKLKYNIKGSDICLCCLWYLVPVGQQFPELTVDAFLGQLVHLGNQVFDFNTSTHNVLF